MGTVYSVSCFPLRASLPGYPYIYIQGFITYKVPSSSQMYSLGLVNKCLTTPTPTQTKGNGIGWNLTEWAGFFKVLYFP